MSCPFEVGEREIEGVVLLDLQGRLVLGEATKNFGAVIDRLHTDSKIFVILNMRQVSTIDSTGLGALVSAHSAFEKRAGGLKLLKVQARQLELMVLTKLNTVFQLFDEERTAIDSFFPDRQPRKFNILEFVQSQPESSEEFNSSDAGSGQTK